MTSTVRDASPIAIPRDVVEHLAQIPRAPGSPGEAEAAEWIAARLQQAGCDVTIDPAEFYDGYAKPIGGLAALATAGGLLAASGVARGKRWRRRAGGTLAALAAAGIADDVSNGPRIVRGLTPPRPTQNVIAITGDRTAERTLVLFAHHDAAPTGAIFDDTVQAWVGERFPGLLERVDTSLPLWWAVLSGPLLAATGASRGSRAMTLVGAAGSAIAAGVFADIASSPTVPGANDNLSAVAVLVALAERWRTEPIPGLRVMLVSCGAEEVIQGGIYSFAKRRFPELDRNRTWFLGLETVGSPELALVEGEGALIMEDYTDRRFRDRVVLAAQRANAPLRRGMRARNSTDAVIPSRAGYPTAMLISMDRYKALSNYHQMSDTPENLHYRTLEHAAIVCEATARELASCPWISHPDA
jgi:hypothetical protein